MAKIKVNTTGKAFTGKVVTFTAPCGCDQVTDGLVINGETYTVCDAMGECVTGKGGAWCAGAQISVVLDCENKKAYIQNAAIPEITPESIGAAASSHNHSAADITGTLAVAHGGTGQTTLTPAVATSAARAIHAGTADMTAGTTALTTGAIYLVYE